MMKRAHDEKISRWEESGPTTQSALTPSIDLLRIHTIWIIVFRLSPYTEQQLAPAQIIREVGVRTQDLESRTGENRRYSGDHVGLSSANGSRGAPRKEFNGFTVAQERAAVGEGRTHVTVGDYRDRGTMRCDQIDMIANR